MKKLSFLSAIAGALLSASAMQASTTTISLSETGFATLVASSSTGVVGFNQQTYGDFVLNNVTGLGSPFYTAPELNLQTLNVTSNTLTTPVNLNIELTETGLTSPTVDIPVLDSMTGNFTGVTTETISSYYDPNDVAGAMTVLLAQATFTQQGSNSYNQPTTIIATGPYSETEMIAATFGAPGTDTLNSSDHITPTAPEPLSMGLMGAGFFGLGLMAYRRKKS